MKNLIKIIIVFLTIIPLSCSAQSRKFLDYSGQWQRNNSEKCFTEFLTIGQDNYYVWVREGDPCQIYTVFGKWSYSQDTLFLNSKIILSDEYGNGNYFHEVDSLKECYSLKLDGETLYLIGINKANNDSVNFIDYSECKDCTYDLKYPIYFKKY